MVVNHPTSVCGTFQTISSQYNRHRCCPEFSKTSGYSVQVDIVAVVVVVVVVVVVDLVALDVVVVSSAGSP